MKSLLSNSALANVIIAICVGFSYYLLDNEMDLMHAGHNPLVGYIMLALTLLAIPFSLIKAKHLTWKREGKITKAELFISSMLFFTAFFTTVFIAFMACSLIDTQRAISDEMLYVFYVVGGLALIGFLWEAFILFIAGAKKEPNKILVRASNFILPLYAGFAIAILWEGAFDQAWEESIIDMRKILLSIIMALILILPFQRLFWYETFINSAEGKESRWSVVSILIAITTAVAGVL